MVDRFDSCPSCGRYTTQGHEQRAVEYRQKPLSAIDLNRPLSELVSELRSDMVGIRSKLQDIGWGYTGWASRLENVQGLLTCGLIALHGVMEEMREHEKKYPKDAA